MGELEFDDLPLPMQRLLNPEEVQKYDTSTIGVSQYGSNVMSDINGGVDEHGSEWVRIVQNQSLNYFLVN